MISEKKFMVDYETSLDARLTTNLYFEIIHEDKFFQNINSKDNNGLCALSPKT